MKSTTNFMSRTYRHIIHYILIGCVVILQIVLFAFLYNEYFNNKKLEELQNQLDEINRIETIVDEANSHFITAHTALQTFLSSPQKSHLETYVSSLNGIAEQLQQLDSVPHIQQEIVSLKLQNDVQVDFNNLRKGIDSLKLSTLDYLNDLPNFEFESLNIQTPLEQVDIQTTHVENRQIKKKFLPRIIDAIKGTEEVQHDTVFINTSYQVSVDTAQLQFVFDSIIAQMNAHYLEELKKYNDYVMRVQTNNKNISKTYDHLLFNSIQLMQVYNHAIKDYGQKILNEYEDLNSHSIRIRKYSVIGLMILIFIILGILMYYTKMNFIYEKRLEEAEIRARDSHNFKSRLLGMLSHEIRSPLKIINIFIAKILKRANDEVVVDALKSIQFTNNSLLLQATQILEYTKNQYQPIILHPEVFILKEEIQHLLNILSTYIHSGTNQLKIDNEIPENIIVYADKIKLHQLFLNILGNANKYTENGRISVHLHTEQHNPQFINLTVTVQDNGIGISPEDLEHIMKPFYQGIPTSRLENLGVGLGLNLCKEIIEAFSGKMYIDSTLKQGTTVSIVLPLKLNS